MNPMEQQYKELVDEKGYSQVKAVADTLELVDSARELLFACCVNAYWRGANKALDDCRKLLHKKGTVDERGKPTN